MDEVESHRGRRPDEIVKPSHEPGERSYLDDAEREFRDGGHRLDATPGETDEQELSGDASRAPPAPLPSGHEPAARSRRRLRRAARYRDLRGGLLLVHGARLRPGGWRRVRHG